MATTLNGWPAITSSASNQLRTIKIPGTSRHITVQKDAAPLFASFFADWQREMPSRLSLNPGPTDGYNYRPSRFSSGLSNHSSGTAVDVLYSSVLKADGQGHMTANEKTILDRILSRYVTTDGHRVLANGEWWDVPHRDGMHTELSQSWDRGARRNTNLADVHNVIKRLNIDVDGHRKIAKWDGVIPEYANVITAEKDGLANIATYRLACRLFDLGYFTSDPAPLGKQGYPVHAVEAFQEKVTKSKEPVGKYGPITHKMIFS